MSLSYEIRESANSVAKKYDHSALTKLHVLYGIRRKFPDQLNGLSLEAIEEKISALPSAQTGALGVTEEVDELFDVIILFHADDNPLHVPLEVGEFVFERADILGD